MRSLVFIIVLLLCGHSFAQDVNLYKQFGGRLDFTMFGNTLNQEENGLSANCVINTASSADFQLQANDSVVAAYLYWAGSGSGDVNVKLNNVDITATRVFKDTLQPRNLEFFSAFAEVTEQVKSTGNANYTLSDLDVSDVIPTYCTNATNFAGWAVVVIYQNENLEFNQINVYDGLQHVPDQLTIILNNLNVIDTIDAKIGFLAWEGDRGLSVNESLFVNGNLISNAPLNPENNAFNGTNSFTGASDLYNMDMDFYNLQNNINTGDTSAIVQLTSGQDFVMINSIITKLNSQLPDATVSIKNISVPECFTHKILINFTIDNKNSTSSLPAGTSIHIYIENILVETLLTTTEIPINGFEEFEILVEVPENVTPNFLITIIIDEENAVLETNEMNNTDNLDFSFPLPPETITLEPLVSCNEGFKVGTFNLRNSYDFIRSQYPTTVSLQFFPSEEDVLANSNEIEVQFAYQNPSNSQIIYIKTTDTISGCFVINQLALIIENCPPTVYTIFTPNGDLYNEVFFIDGLKNIFTQYKLFVFNRYGRTVYQGTNTTPFWNGKLDNTKDNLPSTTYFYVLEFNDSITKPLKGWVYLAR